MDEIDPKIIKNTQETLGKIIKKPPLTDKLLSRPPLRFIHDICTSFMKATGLLDGLYTAEELNPDTMKDKEKKLNFVCKLIDYVTLAHNRALDIKATAVVAGKESDKTNLLLIDLAQCVNLVKDNKTLVVRTLQGEAQKIRLPSKSNSSESAEIKPSKKTKVAKEEVSAEVVPQAPKKSEKRAAEDENDRFVSAKGRRRSDAVAKPKQVKPAPEQPPPIIEAPAEPSVKPALKEDISSSPVRLQRPSSAKGNRRRKEVEVVSTSSEEKQLKIPGANSARQPTAQKKPVYLSESSDENDDYVIEEYRAPAVTEPSSAVKNGVYSDVVVKLAKSKEDYSLKNGSQPPERVSDPVAQRQEKANVEKEIGQLTQSLQQLCKSSLPFARLLEHVQEELDNMQQEYSKWHTEKLHYASVASNGPDTADDDSMESLKTQLADSELRVAQYQESIRATKESILQNQLKIQRLINVACENI